ncbi:Abi family protein [Bacteroides acidifaciens]|jgi:abortive infection bacteriophage resistance protein|uniref:Abi family protein n=1 Tax=Bacteroides acidifaciens TaxID=85831 RepID=UPI002570BD8C|nr:Abi family protein [Bacteroides acidifaciens]
MAKRKIPYTKRATTYDEQIANLRRHGVVISDEAKAKECLADMGYYRLGFYLHPFEITYPCVTSGRSHNVHPGTRIEDAVALYYFDLDLRNILNRYLSRIEVAIRNIFIYELSNKYIDNPTWFVDPNVVTADFISDFPTAAYNSIKKNEVIKRHHHKYIGQYAPAWKTMEYMTLGNIEILYDSLILDKDKKLVSNRFGEPATATFKSYLSAVREVRNACAHGKALFDLNLSFGIRSGKAGAFQGIHRHTFREALIVVNYLLSRISVNRITDMWNEIYDAARELYVKAPSVRSLIEQKTGIRLPSEDI